MTLNCSYKAAIALSKDGKFHARKKHIDLSFQFIHKAIEDGTIMLAYCPPT